MWHWNTTQPGGQGTLQDFDKYFALPGDAGKEVCLRFDHIHLTDTLNLPQPFRKELKAAQIAAVSSYIFAVAFAHNFVTTEEDQNGCQKDH